MERLQGKIAIITGGANGIGKATVKKFISEGAQVVIWDVDEKEGKETAALYSTDSNKCLFFKVDITDIESISTAADKVVDAFGGVDILINNAGITRDASMKKMTPEQWDTVIAVNLTGVFNCTKIIAPLLIERGGGRILNASSVVALYGNFGQTNYVATKAGLIGMTKTWAREYGRKGITVNAIAPGFIKTEMLDTIPDNIIQDLVAKIPMGKLGEVEDIANAYAFLASDEAKFITGTVLSVDGGIVL